MKILKDGIVIPAGVAFEIKNKVYFRRCLKKTEFLQNDSVSCNITHCNLVFPADFKLKITSHHTKSTAVTKFTILAIVQICIFSITTSAQEFKPGLPGMAPIRWLTIKNTHAPGRAYQSLNGNSRTYTVEDTYVKAWIPLVLKPRFAMAIGPHYRSEILELKGAEDDSNDQMASWKLRTIGVDIKSCLMLDSSSWLINTANISQSGNVNDNAQGAIPVTYTVSSTYLRRTSANTEMGLGIMFNKSNSTLVLPVFVYNHNFSAKQGLEISLPHKIAWRYNLTPTDIIYLKSEANIRTYYIREPVLEKYDMFRRIDVDMGVTYNKQITGFMGAELFAGYRHNLSYHLPESISAVRNSGFVASLEIYIRPPKGLLSNKKRS